MSNETKDDILQRNIREGDNAQKAYDLYNKAFIERSKARIFEAIEALSLEDDRGLLKLKLMLHGVKSLEDSILSEIESRDFALKQIKEDKEG